MPVVPAPVVVVLVGSPARAGLVEYPVLVADTVTRSVGVCSVDAWVMLGNEHFRKREFRAALQQYQRALQINPDYDLATINLAMNMLLLGTSIRLLSWAIQHEREAEPPPTTGQVSS